MAMRRAGASSDHVDRGLEFMDRQRLSRVHPSRLHRRAGIADGQDGFARRQVRRAGVCSRTALKFAIYLQLLGGVWIIQTLPSVIFGLYTRWFHDRALLLGWLAGIVAGTAMAASQQFKPIYPLHLAGWTIPCYAALAVNLIVVILLTPLLGASRRGADETEAAHYV
jgi:hypothetical protein